MNLFIRALRAARYGRACRLGFFFSAVTLLSAASGCSTLHRDTSFYLDRSAGAVPRMRAVCFDHLDKPGRAHPMRFVCEAADAAGSGCREAGTRGENIDVDFEGHRLLIRVETRRGIELSGPVGLTLFPQRLGSSEADPLIVHFTAGKDDSLGLDHAAFALEGMQGFVASANREAGKGLGVHTVAFILPGGVVPQGLRLRIEDVWVDDRLQTPRTVSLRNESHWHYEFARPAVSDQDQVFARQASCAE